MYENVSLNYEKPKNSFKKYNITADYRPPPLAGKVRSEAPENFGANEVINNVIKICVMEADAGRIDEMDNLFQSMGHEVLFLNYVIGASNEIRSFDPDILLLDLNMPTISGYKLVNVLKENLEHFPPTILYTKMEEDKLKAIAKSTTVDNYVVKNEDYMNIVSKVKSMIVKNFIDTSVPANA
jgi:two-component system, OmpR family, response regulator